MNVCPHCGLEHGREAGQVPYCPDTNHWTQAERDAWREQAKRRDPTLKFAPSTAALADRFGDRNRRDRLAQQEAQDAQA